VSAWSNIYQPPEPKADIDWSGDEALARQYAAQSAGRKAPQRQSSGERPVASQGLGAQLWDPYARGIESAKQTASDVGEAVQGGVRAYGEGAHQVGQAVVGAPGAAAEAVGGAVKGQLDRMTGGERAPASQDALGRIRQVGVGNLTPERMTAMMKSDPEGFRRAQQALKDWQGLSAAERAQFGADAPRALTEGGGVVDATGRARVSPTDELAASNMMESPRSTIDVADAEALRANAPGDVAGLAANRRSGALSSPVDQLSGDNPFGTATPAAGESLAEATGPGAPAEAIARSGIRGQSGTERFQDWKNMRNQMASRDPGGAAPGRSQIAAALPAMEGPTKDEIQSAGEGLVDTSKGISMQEGLAKATRGKPKAQPEAKKEEGAAGGKGEKGETPKAPHRFKEQMDFWDSVASGEVGGKTSRGNTITEGMKRRAGDMQNYFARMGREGDIRRNRLQAREDAGAPLSDAENAYLARRSRQESPKGDPNTFNAQRDVTSADQLRQLGKMQQGLI